jgi:hypothetical protein|tara:strand:+ start:49 stop:564 length:516 start_codon:yes stop_codon:yes gene_type:complete
MAKAKKKLDIDLDITPAEPEEKIRPYQFKDPYWSNKENKHIIVTLEYTNGKVATASVQDSDGKNPDYIAILEEFGEEQIDANTEEGIKRREENIKKRLARKETEEIRRKQEILFNTKIEAFEITAVKESKNTDLKRLIRKAKTPLEVGALTTLVIQEDLIQRGVINGKEDT